MPVSGRMKLRHQGIANHVQQGCTIQRGNFQGANQGISSWQRGGKPEQTALETTQYEHSETRQGCRSGHYDLRVTHHAPRLKGILFETAIIEHYRHQESSVEETLTYCDLPSEHWTRIQTNNVIERLNREICCHTHVVCNFPDGMMIFQIILLKSAPSSDGFGVLRQGDIRDVMVSFADAIEGIFHHFLTSLFVFFRTVAKSGTC